MPVYNAGIHLKEVIEGVLSQSYRDFEFLIVDDGSTDDSLAIIGTWYPTAHDDILICYY